MKKNSILFSFIALLACFSSVYAQEVKPNSVKTPGTNKVILVGRVVYKTPVNHEARIPEDKKDDKSFQDADTVNLQYGESYYAYTGPNYPIGDTFFYTLTRNSKTKQVSMYCFNAYMFGNSWYNFVLPVLVNIVVPDGVKYVYVGTFEYELDYALRIVGFKHYDEYDRALEDLKIATGKPDVELIRVELNPMEDDE